MADPGMMDTYIGSPEWEAARQAAIANGGPPGSSGPTLDDIWKMLQAEDARMRAGYNANTGNPPLATITGAKPRTPTDVNGNASSSAYSSGAGEGAPGQGSGGSSTPGAPEKVDAFAEAQRLQNQLIAAQIANENARSELAKAQAAQANDPATKNAMVQEAQARADAARIQLTNAVRALEDYESPSSKRAGETAAAKEKADYEANIRAKEQASSQGFTSSENAAQRDFTAKQNAAKLAADQAQADRQAQIALRQQELESLKAQDSWVMDTLKTQIASGQLSLAKANDMFNAYVTKARLPSQILESVSKAIEPTLPYLTARNAGESAPGFEAGGPIEQLMKRGGASYDPAQYAVRPITLDLKGEAAKLGADWSSSGKVPDVGKVFSSVPDIKVNPGASAVSGLSAASSLMPSPPSSQPLPADQAAMRSALEAGTRKVAP